MAKQPRKGTIGWKYEADVCGSGFQVAGPGLGNTYCDHREDAEMIAAALNLAANFAEIKRRAETVKQELEYLTEFK